jgi:pantetheine-phosphate adenylyltransferase
MTRAVYPGTFDPITNGHVDLVKRAARVFDRLVVAVGTNPAKTPLFSPEERLDMVRHELRAIPNVTTDAFDGLLVDYARSRGISVVLRGIRSLTDLDYEYQMALANRSMENRIETIFMPASIEYSFVSAQLLREIVALGGDASRFVSPRVAQRLKKKLASGPARSGG